MKSHRLLNSLFILGLLGSVLLASGCQSASLGSLMSNPFSGPVPQQWEPEIVEGTLAPDEAP
jgi:hypothetical protein